MRSLTARMLLLVVAVAVTSSLLTSVAFARVLGSGNQAQAALTLASDATSLAARAAARPRLPAADLTAYSRDITIKGYVVAVVMVGAVPGREPFTAADVDSATDDAPAVQRSAAGSNWLVAARPTGDGRVALLARPVAGVSRLTAQQLRRALFGGGIGLAAGVLAGLLLALSVTRPLGRLASAARRLSAGEREVEVPPEGPSEVADVAEALAGLSRALASSEQRQRQFLLAVSHELRTPLTAVTGYAEALADGALPAQEVPRAAAVVRREAGRLQRRVEDLMALARLEADDFRLNPAPTDVGALIRAAGAAFAPRAYSAGVQLAVQVPPAGPVVITDGERLRQAVDALADNALKVLQAGAPLVLACAAIPDGGVLVEVRDGGPGLPAEDLAVAFERGVLSDRYRGIRPVGSGVGLALVGELARRMGGFAQAGPATEGGVCFSITLPPAPPSRPSPTR
jgi:two-component system, OmpR family, sensor kinase